MPRPTRFALAAAMALATAAPSLADDAAAALLEKVDAALYLDSYSFSMAMETREPGAEPRLMAFEGFSKRGKGTYFEVSAPARTAGTRFLQLEGSLWLYNPKSGSTKAVRLSARDAFQGSTFSNADVGKNQFSDDYDASLEPDEALVLEDGSKVACRRISALAKTADSAYGKIAMWIRAADDMPVRMEYYARSGLLYKRMDLSKVARFGSFSRPSVMRMESLEKKGTVTTLTIRALEARPVADTTFNKNYLTR